MTAPTNDRGGFPYAQMALPKKNQLKGKREFSRIFSETRPIASEHFSLRVTRNKADQGRRFAIVVPAKIVALATTRNLLRRRTSEVLSRIIRESSVSSDIRAVLSIRTPQVPEATALEHELLLLMKKSGILNT